MPPPRATTGNPDQDKAASPEQANLLGALNSSVAPRSPRSASGNSLVLGAPNKGEAIPIMKVSASAGHTHFMGTKIPDLLDSHFSPAPAMPQAIAVLPAAAFYLEGPAREATAASGKTTNGSGQAALTSSIPKKHASEALPDKPATKATSAQSTAVLHDVAGIAEPEKVEQPEPEPGPEPDNEDQKQESSRSSGGSTTALPSRKSAAAAVLTSAATLLTTFNSVKLREPKCDGLARVISSESEDPKNRWDISHARMKFSVRLAQTFISLPSTIKCWILKLRVRSCTARGTGAMWWTASKKNQFLRKRSRPS